jgi:hypothetical protein
MSMHAGVALQYSPVWQPARLGRYGRLLRPEHKTNKIKIFRGLDAPIAPGKRAARPAELNNVPDVSRVLI